MSYHNNPSARTPRQKSQPATIAELADKANADLDDHPAQGLKNWLRTAEKARKTGQYYKERGDLELAFVEFAKAATIVLDRIPRHPEYPTLLNGEQRHNLGNNGQDILTQLGECKSALVQRYEDWYKGVSSSRSSSSEHSSFREEALRIKKEQERLALEEERAQHALEATRQEQEWQRNNQSRRQTESPAFYNTRQPSDPRREERTQDIRDIRREEDARRQAQAAAAVAEEEALKRRISDRRQQEQAGILRRQQEADAAARAVRRDLTYGRDPAPPPVVQASANVAVHAPQPSRPPSSNQDVVFAPTSSYLEPGMPQAMPLESPNRLDYDSSTEAEGSDTKAPWQRGRHNGSSNLTPTRTKPGGIVYPVPLTTTSPAPPELGQIEYPRLMSQHQLKQGYVPSLQSMFSQMSLDQPTSSSALLFDAKPDSYPGLPHPPASAPISYPGMPVPNHIPHPLPQPPIHSHTHPPPHLARGPSPSGARPPPPPIPPKQPIPPPAAPSAPRIVKGDSKDPNVRELKSVRLPRECLPKFLSIARVNTLQNRETCGLLLGKDKGSKYVVTTLLVPKQHSTSDTCTMDEEELVMQFTEERHLITLGWIHTHPTQSCFMSSVDLHTHSGFQCMLPESFAVVCAPSSTPTFGIFRLTDPEGLQTILHCNAKEAFHPHPEVPIYTDCDNSHVQMRDMPLEIVDLR